MNTVEMSTTHKTALLVGAILTIGLFTVAAITKTQGWTTAAIIAACLTVFVAMANSKSEKAKA